MPEEDSNPSWRTHLNVKDELDVLDESPGKKYWCPARVIEVRSDRVKITYLDWSSKWDEWIERSSKRLARYGSHVFREGSVLKIGQRIEVFDMHPKREVWTTSYVCDVDHVRVKVHFVGFAKKFDEWIARDSKRIRPFRFEKRLRRNQTSSRGRSESNKQVVRIPLSDLNGSEEVPKRKRALQSNDPRYIHFERGLCRLGYRVVKSKGDGNCLFRSIAKQLYEHDEVLAADNSTEAHRCVRVCAVNYMRVLRRHFEPFIAGLRVRSVRNRKQQNESKVSERDIAVSFDEYTREMERDRVWGDDPEITAMCEIYDRPVEIYVFDSRSGAKLMKTFHENRLSSRVPFRLSYYGGGHYDAIVPIIAQGTTTSTKLKSRPGVYERTRIELARIMSSGGGGGGGTTRSESQMLAQAMEMSRREYEKKSTDLDLALALSMRDPFVERAIEASMEKQVHDTMEVSREQEERRRIEEATRMSLEVTPMSDNTNTNTTSSSKIDDDAEDAMLQAAIAASMMGTTSTTTTTIRTETRPTENPIIENLMAVSGHPRAVCIRALEISEGNFQKALDFLISS